MIAKKGKALDALPLPEATRKLLADLWITTVQEFQAAAHRQGGPLALANYLNVSETTVLSWRVAADGLVAPVVGAAGAVQKVYGQGAVRDPRRTAPTEEGAQLIAPAEPGVAGGPGAPPLLATPPLPDGVDLHHEMPPIRSQGARQTCVAFACLAAFEYLLGGHSDLSEQFLYYQCKQQDGYGRAGTYLRTGISCLQNLGACDERLDPYQPTPNLGDPTDAQDPPSPPAILNALTPQHRSAGTPPPYDDIPPINELLLRQALAQGTPVPIVMDTFDYWHTGPGAAWGDIRLPIPRLDNQLEGHAVCLVGYQTDSDVPGGGYFIFRNSWDTDWAAQSPVAPGYGRIPYAYIKTWAWEAHAVSLNHGVGSGPAGTVPPEGGTGGLARFVPAADSNFERGRNNRQPLAIVNHISLSSLEYLRRRVYEFPQANASAHYAISKTGQIIQFVPDKDTAFLINRPQNPDLDRVPWLAEVPWESDQPTNAHAADSVALNIVWEGVLTRKPIGAEYPPAKPLTPADLIAVDVVDRSDLIEWEPNAAQYQAGRALISYLCSKYSIAADRQHIGLHSDLNTTTRWFCPPPEFPLGTLLNDLAQISLP